MPEREVCSPVSREGSVVGSNKPKSPGAFSSPSRGDSVPGQLHHTATPVRSHSEGNQEPEPGMVNVVGLED
jgi:hypothetical protein